MLYFSSSEATQHTHRSRITKAGNTQPPTQTLVQQRTLYIFCSEALCTLKDAELQRKGIKRLTLISFDLIFCAPIKTYKASNSNV